MAVGRKETAKGRRAVVEHRVLQNESDSVEPFDPQRSVEPRLRYHEGVGLWSQHNGVAAIDVRGSDDCVSGVQSPKPPAAISDIDEIVRFDPESGGDVGGQIDHGELGFTAQRRLQT